MAIGQKEIAPNMSILQYPSSIVRKASATVSSTVSSVASVASGSSSGRRATIGSQVGSDIDILLNAKDKQNLQIKSSPIKDANTMRRLAIKSGYLHKRNEQGTWQKRFICLVPHTFLYYYDNDTSDNPRGIIDMELYTNLSVEGHSNDTIKMSTLDETSQRSYYFLDDDCNVVSDWLTAFHQERFFSIREEINALKQVLDQSSSEISTKGELVEEWAHERERMKNEIENYKLAAEESLNEMKRSLVQFGITEEEMEAIDTPSKAGDQLRFQIDRMCKEFEDTQATTDERNSRNIESLNQRISSLENEVSNEQQARKGVEDILSHLRSELEQRKTETIIELEKAGMNIQIAVNAKTIAEKKAATLSDQKKLLVKEVKQLRSKVDQSQDTINQLKSLNDRLTSALATINESSGVNTPTSMHSTTGLSLGAISSMGDLFYRDDNNKSPTSSTTSKSESMSPSAGTVIHEDGKETDNHNSDGQDIKTNAEPQAWEAPQQDLTDYEWLSDEQRQLLEKRNESHLSSNIQEYNVSTTSETPILSSLLSPVTFLTGTTANSSTISPHPRKENNRKERKMSDQFMAIFQHDKSNNTPILQIDDEEVDSTSKTARSIHSERVIPEVDSSAPVVEDDRAPTSMRLHCLRCHGTVEGPKYSTCKCLVPALTPDDLGSTTSSGPSIIGIFSKGVESAGGLAGGLASGFARRVTSGTKGKTETKDTQDS